MKKIYKFLLNSLPRPILIRFSYLFKLIAPYLYSGDNVECPCCGKSFRKFLSYGYGKSHRENVLCPYDLTLERHRLMWLYLKDHSNFFSKKINLLHIAPEQSFFSLFKKQKNLNYLTGDLISPIAEMHFDLHSIPLEDNRFDVIFCNHVLEHVDDAIKCMRELYRVMKPGGWGIMQVPQDTSRKVTYEDSSIVSAKDREKHFWQKDHVRLFGMDYPEWLKNAGFNVKTFDFNMHYDEKIIEKYRLSKSEILYIVSKL